MRRHLLLPVIFLVLFLAGTAAAQGSFIEYNNKNDPCGRFKMRILVPVDNADHNSRIKKVGDGIDQKMVWNPCPSNVPQFAVVPLQPRPGWRRDFLGLGTFKFQWPMTSKDWSEKRVFRVTLLDRLPPRNQ